MDELDRKILALLSENARMTIKDIAAKVSLTSPAVSERIRRMERSGLIEGYTVCINHQQERSAISAMISIYVTPADREAFHQLLKGEAAVEECLQVTGQQSHMVRVRCRDIESLDLLISKMQKLGQTNTQIILSVIKGVGPGAWN